MLRGYYPLCFTRILFVVLYNYHVSRIYVVLCNYHVTRILSVVLCDFRATRIYLSRCGVVTVLHYLLIGYYHYSVDFSGKYGV
jgi:hypothetical protein